MKDFLILIAHLLTTIAKLLGPGGVRAIVADSLLMKQQLLISVPSQTCPKPYSDGSIPVGILVAFPCSPSDSTSSSSHSSIDVTEISSISQTAKI